MLQQTDPMKNESLTSDRCERFEQSYSVRRQKRYDWIQAHMQTKTAAAYAQFRKRGRQKKKH